MARSFVAAALISTWGRGGESDQDFRHRNGDLLVIDGMDAREAGGSGRHRQLEVIEQKSTTKGLP